MIRRATVSDANAISDVHAASIRGLARQHYSGEQIATWIGNRSSLSYLAPIVHKFVLVHEDDSRVRAFAQLNLETSTVEAVYVEPKYARKGIGASLVVVLETYALNTGVIELRLDSSLNAVGFYERLGYTSVAQTEHLLELGVSIPCISMCKILDANDRSVNS